MDNREIYNYKLAYEHPYVIRKVTNKIYVPFGGIRLARFVTFIVIFGIEILFRDFIFSLKNVMPGLDLVVLVGLPYFLSGWLLKINPDGKKIHYFLWDYAVYFFTIKVPKKRFSGDVPVLYLDKPIQLERRR
ncbi:MULTISPECIES: TcpE family conjugal transfer membrane protein [unclassified Listeria]|uniref:TcpE family conjugal transfer membrane protein n=1 Tax=unclassified Listeria TaxID=2642072 RepID=UPI000B590B65|nr:MULTISPECIES: TcpE family conjugal transfer membrane protein [unclassified Listeria]